MKNKLIPILLFLSIYLNAQSVQYAWRNFTTNDGLPSPEVYTVIQDSKGFLWFGTDNGVSRYDGYTFQNFGAPEGLTDNVINCIQEDKAGRIWLGSMWGKVFYCENGVIHPFAYNHLIEAYRKSFYVIAGISRFEKHGNTEGGVLVGMVNLGILKIYDNGQSELIAAPQAPALLSFTSDKKNILVSQVVSNGVSYPHLTDRSLPLFVYDGQKLIEQGAFKIKSLQDDRTNARLKTIGNSTYLFTGKSIHRQKEDKSFNRRPYDRPIFDVLTDEDGLVWTAEGLNGGVRAFKNAEEIGQSPLQIILEGVSAVTMLRDRDGGYWVTTLDEGVFYLRDKRITIFNKDNTGFPFNILSSIDNMDASKVFVGFKQGEVGLFDKNTYKYQSIARLPNDPIYNLKWDARHKQLWFGGFLLRKWQNEHISTLEKTNSVATSVGGVKKIALNFQKNAVWVIGAGGLREVIGLTARRRLSEDAVNAKDRLFSVFEDRQQRVWVGKQDGLYRLEKESWVAVGASMHTALTARIEDMAELPNGSLVFATKGNGLVIWDGKKAINIRKQEGLQTDMLENVATDSLGNIWVGTLAGLYKISRKDGNGQWHVQPITIFQGLPSNEINDIAPIVIARDKATEGGVWVATPKGLVLYQDKPSVDSVRMPFLDYFRAVDSLRDLSQSRVLAARENDIDIAWHCINFKMNGKIPYRYRLHTSDEWRHTYNKNIQLPSLFQGDYDFEVQAQNENGVWSASLKTPFTVLPYWFETWWFRTLLIVSVAAVSYLYYQNRIKRLQKEHALALQINDLERSALATQMNPHFIFNCLNSIQLLIQRGEKNEAMTYLSRFAKMVRLTLESTRRGKVSVEEEVETLSNYLTLEKLRFKEQLSFSIVTNSEIDAYNIEIPAMLIQPFVENALKHGFDSMSKTALVTISFDADKDFLFLKIRDNGKGYIFKESVHTEEEDCNEKTSVGIELSRQRLALHNGQRADEDLSITPIFDENKNTLGTEVCLKIKIIKA
ncbi:MAG: histidine kinase [Saprospiraceae bacterium]|nr:histidine kinase [Saprospiraceae bacterium]